MVHGATSTPTRVLPLDGLRGWGTCFVLVGHLGIARFWPHLAGVLAVSMFFTLSGFLITTALLRQLDRGGIAWGRFYTGRIRRLLPAATVTVAGVVVAWRITGRTLPTRDVASSLLYVRNWDLLASGSDYGAVFNEAGPLTHYWSLAIEEQYYVVLPALLALLVWMAKGRTRLIGPTLTALTIASFVDAAHLDATVGRTSAYYNTASRAGEFLTGTVLAAVLARPAARRWADSWAARRTTPAVVAALVAVSLVAWQRVGFDAPHLFDGVTAANAAIVAVMLAFFTAPASRGPGVAFLSWRPMAGLGRRSYSVYLAHWPVYLLIDDAGPAQLVESVAKIAAALAVGLTLFALVEEPVHRRVRLPSTTQLHALLVSTAVVCLGVSWTAPVEEPLVDVAAINTSTDDFFHDLPTTTPGPTTTPDTTTPDATTPGTTTPAPVPPVAVQRVLVVGDSNSYTSTLWMEDHRDELPWDWRLWAGTGCGTTSGTSRIWTLDGVIEPDDPAKACPTWVSDLGAAVRAYDPDIVLVVSTGADLAAHDLGDGVWRGLDDPLYASLLEERQHHFLDIVTSTGARVGWMDSAGYRVVDPATGDVGTGTAFFINDDDGTARLDAMLHALAAEHPDQLEIVPFAAWADTWPGGRFDPAWRPDGAHLDGTRPEVAAWIVAQVDAVARGDLREPAA